MSNISPAPRWQFSLRWLLIAVAVVAVALAIGLSAWAELLATTFYWALPTPLVIAAIYGRGEVRAFSIGGLVPLIPAIIRGPWGNSPISLILNILWLILAVGICGVLAVASRRWIERHGGTSIE